MESDHYCSGELKILCVVGLEIYRIGLEIKGPVNTNKVMSSQSVDLRKLFLGRRLIRVR